MRGKYKRAAEIALEQSNYALYQLFCVPIAVDSTLKKALVDALNRFDDVAASKLLDVYIARIADNGYAGRIGIEDSDGEVTITMPTRSRLNPFKHQHDNVIDGLLDLYLQVPLLKPVGGFEQVSQDERVPRDFQVGCLEETKKKIFETLAFYWAHTENPALSLRILHFFLELPFKEGDDLRNDAGKSRDREFALAAIKGETENIDEFSLTQQILGVSKRPKVFYRGLFSGSETEYREKLLRSLIMGLLRQMKTEALFVKVFPGQVTEL